MPWFKVSDQLPLHPKFVDLPPSAVGLWTLAGSWCAQQLTDGHVPPRIVARLGCTTDDALELVKVGLWHEEPGGFVFHDWDKYQPSRAEVQAEREANAERMREARAKRKGVRSAAAKPAPDDVEDEPEPDPVEGEDTGSGGSASERADERAPARAPERADAVSVTPTQSLSQSLSQSGAAAAAPREGAHDAAAGGPLDELQARCRAVGLAASWRKVAADDRAEMVQLVEVHGVAALVVSAQREHNPNEPAKYAQAWLPGWRELRPPRADSGRRPTTSTCPIHPGEHPIKCPQCAKTGKAMPDGFRESLRRNRSAVPIEAGQDQAEPAEDLADVETGAS